MDREKLRITDAAVMWKGKIYIGKRHSEIMHQIWDEEQTTNCKITQEMQGFVTNEGKFVNRWQAGNIAFQSGQTKHHYESLLSEYVW